MALPVLDGNQSATTLSSVVTGGEHIVAHSVVSLGANAIANITSAVSGSVVSISNFPATQPISGSISISGTPSVTFSAVSISNFPSTQTIAGAVTANVPLSTDSYAQETGIRVVGAGFQGAIRISGINPSSGLQENLEEGGGIPIFAANQQAGGTLAVSGTVTVGNSVTIAGTVTANPTGTQTIAGTVTANVDINAMGNQSPDTFVSSNEQNPPPNYGVQIGFTETPDNNFLLVKDTQPLPVYGTVTVGNSVTISGTVTANVSTKSWIDISANTQNAQFIAVGGFDGTNNQVAPIPLTDGASGIYVAQDTNNAPFWNVSVEAMPRGALTTRFGTPTTANTAFATSAVTNTSRKYLLIQNVTTGSNVITVGIGFTPTTTQGIQLTAGAGITFESSYIPTGAVYVLSSVTASNFTVLEA